MTAGILGLGAALRATTDSMIAELSPKQREIFDELSAIGVLPVDAIIEATARWPE